MDLIMKQLYFCLFFTKIKNFLNQFKNQSPTSKRHYYYKPYIHIVKCTYQAILEGQYGSRYVSQMGSLLELRVSSFPHKKGGVKKKKEVYIQQGMKYETYLGTFSLIFCSIFSSSLPFFFLDWNRGCSSGWGNIQLSKLFIHYIHDRWVLREISFWK